jgi:hypothetical protein
MVIKRKKNQQAFTSSEQLQCREIDVKLVKALESASEFIRELEDLPKSTIKDGEPIHFYGSTGLNERDCFYLGEEIDEVLEGLTEVNEKETKPSEFRDEFEHFFDDIHHDLALDFIDKVAIEEHDALPEREDITIAIEELENELREALVQYTLNFL